MSKRKKRLTPEDVYCPYCRRKAEFVNNKEIYGKSYGSGHSYICRPCDAYVGTHQGTAKPLGRLANAELRYWKKKAHAAFDPLWQYGRFKHCRNVAYAWLAEKMGKSVQETHIGTFDVADCQRVIAICTDRRY